MMVHFSETQVLEWKTAESDKSLIDADFSLLYLLQKLQKPLGVHLMLLFSVLVMNGFFKMIVAWEADFKAFPETIYDHDLASLGNASADAGNGYTHMRGQFFDTQAIAWSRAEKKFIVFTPCESGVRIV